MFVDIIRHQLFLIQIMHQYAHNPIQFIHASSYTEITKTKKFPFQGFACVWLVVRIFTMLHSLNVMVDVICNTREA